MLLVGADATASETPLVYDSRARTVYGRRWERVDVE